ncbi:outer membrane beta-barrel protein [Salinimonas marina]|uniref:Outer membrane beta-barrel protein n=1 Tax=Salinimonas marina TaxID=2785918 RepID=A0A7S9DYM1_9ALTE|nr:outer membrane beta-barrel protein [Salinimonas marina]QPG06369.1 outer membrane beta-barrel protein [Salinimonas marina]
MKQLWTGVLAAACLCPGAQATEKMYGVIGAGYNDAEFIESDASGAAYYVGLGHQFAPQWYVEGGFKRLFDDIDDDAGAKADALYLALLGKASGREGELYYKLGVMRADVSGGYTVAGEVSGCDYGQVSFGQCRYDEGVFAGLVGFGFDYYLGLNTMLRFEYEHIRGEHDLSVNTATLGFRYNFN